MGIVARILNISQVMAEWVGSRSSSSMKRHPGASQLPMMRKINASIPHYLSLNRLAKLRIPDDGAPLDLR